MLQQPFDRDTINYTSQPAYTEQTDARADDIGQKLLLWDSVWRIRDSGEAIQPVGGANCSQA